MRRHRRLLWRYGGCFCPLVCREMAAVHQFTPIRTTRLAVEWFKFPLNPSMVQPFEANLEHYKEEDKILLQWSSGQMTRLTNQQARPLILIGQFGHLLTGCKEPE